jgi:hypothetical protein
MRVPGTDGRADKRFALLGRYSSEIRTGCANERPSGSVRGAPGNWCPYRDRQPFFGHVPITLQLVWGRGNCRRSSGLAVYVV